MRCSRADRSRLPVPGRLRSGVVPPGAAAGAATAPISISVNETPRTPVVTTMNRMRSNRLSTAPRYPSARRGRSLVGAVLVAASAIALAACSSSTASPSTTSAPASTSTNPNPAAVSTASRSTVGVVLVGANGHTLYRLMTDTPGTSTCTGSCAQLWPPLTVTAGTRPVGASGLGGTLSSFTRSDGTTQVAYNGEPLYYYAQDTTTSDALGEGVGGVWFTVKSTTGSTTGATSTSTTARSGGYGY